MDIFEDRIESYYQKIDKESFDKLIEIVQDLKLNELHSVSTKPIDFFETLKELRFSPKIYLDLSFIKDKNDLYNLYRNKHVILDELKMIRSRFLNDRFDFTTLGTWMDTKDKLEFFMFNDSALKNNFSYLKNNFDIDPCRVSKEIKISFLKGIHDSIGHYLTKDKEFLMSYTFYNHQNEIEIYKDAKNNHFFQIRNKDYKLTFFKDDYVGDFYSDNSYHTLSYENLKDGMPRKVSMTFDTLNMDSDPVLFSEHLCCNLSDNNRPSYVYYFQNEDKKIFDKNFIFRPSSSLLTNTKEFLNDNSFFKAVITSHRSDKENLSKNLLNLYQNNFNISKESDFFHDMLTLHDMQITYNDVFDKVSEKNLYLLNKFEELKNKKFGTKYSKQHTTKSPHEHKPR